MFPIDSLCIKRTRYVCLLVYNTCNSVQVVYHDIVVAIMNCYYHCSIEYRSNLSTHSSNAYSSGHFCSSFLGWCLKYSEIWITMPLSRTYSSTECLVHCVVGSLSLNLPFLWLLSSQDLQDTAYTTQNPSHAPPCMFLVIQTESYLRVCIQLVITLKWHCDFFSCTCLFVLLSTSQFVRNPAKNCESKSSLWHRYFT